MESNNSGSVESPGGKGMLADLLEREVKKEAVNGGATPAGKEIRISDNGLELVQNDSRGRFAVDMGVVGMNDIGGGVDLGDGAAAPKAAHLIAQVDDSGHVQIHLEEEMGSAVCNGQSLLDQLEACEVSSSTDQIVAANQTTKAVKRPADPVDDSPAPKKPAITNHVANTKLNENAGGILEKAIEMTLSEQQMADKSKEKMSNGGVNGIVETAATSQPPPPPATILGPNTPRTFLILQQQTPQQARLGFPQQGQRLLLAIQRPGGVIQHVAMPANVVAITSSQLQTNGAAVVTLTSSGLGTVNREQLVASNGQVSSVSLSTNGLPVRSTAQAITTVASTVSNVVTTASMEGVVTFSGGAVAFPARPTENTTRNLAESHVTITPVPASSIASPAVTSPSTAPAAAATPASKKRANSIEIAKPRGRPMKSKSTDSQPAASSPSPQPVDPSLQYMCEWKDCMRYNRHFTVCQSFSNLHHLKMNFLFKVIQNSSRSLHSRLSRSLSRSHRGVGLSLGAMRWPQEKEILNDDASHGSPL